jgi:hypothetical protein
MRLSLAYIHIYPHLNATNRAMKASGLPAHVTCIRRRTKVFSNGHQYQCSRGENIRRGGFWGWLLRFPGCRPHLSRQAERASLCACLWTQRSAAGPWNVPFHSLHVCKGEVLIVLILPISTAFLASRTRASLRYKSVYPHFSLSGPVSTVGRATGCRLEGRGARVRVPRRKIFSSPRRPRRIWGSTQPTII